MWAEQPVTRELIDDLVAAARDNGDFIIGAPVNDDVMEALSILAASFPNPTKDLVDAVYTAFDAPDFPALLPER